MHTLFCTSLKIPNPFWNPNFYPLHWLCVACTPYTQFLCSFVRPGIEFARLLDDFLAEVCRALVPFAQIFRFFLNFFNFFKNSMWVFDIKTSNIAGFWWMWSTFTSLMMPNTILNQKNRLSFTLKIWACMPYTIFVQFCANVSCPGFEPTRLLEEFLVEVRRALVPFGQFFWKKIEKN